jgi:hypothetical protein
MGINMKKTNKPSKISWFLRHKLVLFIVLVFVVLPIIMVPTIYITQYNTNKPIIFEDKKAELTRIEDTPFTLDYKVIEMRETSSDLKGGYFRIRYTLTKKDTFSTISNVKLTYQLSTNWERYTATSTEQINPLGTERIAQVNFDFDLDKNILPLVNSGTPILFARIVYTETLLNSTLEHVVYVKLPYDFVSHATKIIPA